MIKIEMEDGGVITLQLYPAVAPITCANFEEALSQKGFMGLYSTGLSMGL